MLTQDTDIFIPAFHSIEPGAWKVQSKSHPSLFHTVRLIGGSLRCSCPGGRYPNCWHRRYVQSFLDFEKVYQRMNSDDTDPEPSDPIAAIRRQLAGENLTLDDYDTRELELLFAGGPECKRRTEPLQVEHITRRVRTPKGKWTLDFTRETEPVAVERLAA